MRHIALTSLILIAGCAQIRDTTDGLFSGPSSSSASEAADAPEADGSEQVEEVVATEEFDPGWTGAKQTIAGLGDVAKPGIWLETPLVSKERSGRVVFRKTGASAFVTLIPIEGEETAGSRLSLEAMRTLLAPIDQLIELDVYTN
ncbi:hypothetical protein Q5Y75_00050 [Ruegeria sp. 2205SS24-7]|uniref:hypothetical protein n=1 Tax=Ruegeria discodermiae TaxID=3064389 RepID=UPI00274053A0|nr:hypothetical protein [Ruegeria sp. 2205SS24-7]MDP5215598.1 hypothetical protein [Ruegeria sp. 2205SS24-7]